MLCGVAYMASKEWSRFQQKVQMPVSNIELDKVEIFPMDGWAQSSFECREGSELFFVWSEIHIQVMYNIVDERI